MTFDLRPCERPTATTMSTSVIAAPPDRLNFDKGALEEEGKEQYLRTLETRLGKLQGSNKQKLTSKEIISSITEARGDHMRQYMTTEATNDPWCSSPTAIRNEYAEMEFEEPQHHKLLSKTNHWGSYLCCCQGSKPAYSRVGVREQRGEEVACLVECDELDLTWQNRNSIT